MIYESHSYSPILKHCRSQILWKLLTGTPPCFPQFSEIIHSIKWICVPKHTNASQLALNIICLFPVWWWWELFLYLLTFFCSLQSFKIFHCVADSRLGRNQLRIFHATRQLSLTYVIGAYTLLNIKTQNPQYIFQLGCWESKPNSSGPVTAGKRLHSNTDETQFLQIPQMMIYDPLFNSDLWCQHHMLEWSFAASGGDRKWLLCAGERTQKAKAGSTNSA